MVDCQANSRHMIGWLTDRLDADKDALFLAVAKAHDPGTGAVSGRWQLAVGSNTQHGVCKLLSWTSQQPK